MNIPAWVGPGAWGVVGGAAAAMIVGFAWGGWVTGATAEGMAASRAKAAVVTVYTPVCVENAKEAGASQLALLKAENSWARGDFIVKAGWVNGIDEKYRGAVAEACAAKAVDAMGGSASSS